MTTSTARACRGDTLAPRAAIPCARCHHPLAENAIHNLIGNTTHVLCTRCVMTISAHRTYYPACPWEHHDLLDHPVTSTTRTTARQLIKQRSTA